MAHRIGYARSDSGDARDRGRHAERALPPFARFEERIDAVGSKRSEVEPAEWRVSLTRRFGIAVALFGILILFDI